MWELIKKIFSHRDRELTVLLLDDDDPEAAGSYHLNANGIVRLAVTLILGSVGISMLIFFLTPVGSVYQQFQEERIRSEVISITEQVLTLRDSLIAQDQQLSDMKQILLDAPDTTFSRNYTDDERFFGESAGYPVSNRFTGPRTFEMMTQSEIVHSEILKNAPDFPAPFPVTGELSQEFSAADAHFGIDIAAQRGTEFHSVADGTVVNAGWTINYGYVIYIQHGNGYMSVYKHGASLLKKKGDIVLKGDILGTIGDSGVLSYGSHLHLEMWKDGVPQNPLMYIIK